MRLRRKTVDWWSYPRIWLSYHFVWTWRTQKANGVSYLLIQSVHYIWSLVRGKAAFIAGMSEAYPDANFVGFWSTTWRYLLRSTKIFEGERDNAKVCLFDIAGIEEVVEPGEVDRFYINFCDPWPKAKHAKRRLTYHTFLDRYARLLKDGGEVHFKTDNEGLFMFSLEEFKECGWELKNVTYDLHSTDLPNVKTEYEEKFSKKGNLFSA